MSSIGRVSVWPRCGTVAAGDRLVSASGTRWLIVVSMRRVDQLGVRGIARARNWTATWLFRPRTECVIRLR